MLWKVEIVAYYKALPQNLLGDSGKITKTSREP